MNKCGNSITSRTGHHFNNRPPLHVGAPPSRIKVISAETFPKTERKPAIAGKSLRYRKSFRAKSAGPPVGRGAKGLYRIFQAAGDRRRDNGTTSRVTITGSVARPGATRPEIRGPWSRE